MYARWAETYRLETGQVVEYAPVGSGAGIDLLARKAVGFGASDVPLSADALQRIGAMQFPAIVGGVVPVVHIAGLKPGALKLTGALLAAIYLGEIVRWDDRRLVELNPTLALPSSRITVVHRSDASGTTFLWSSYLAHASDAWRRQLGSGRTLSWPTGVAAVGNEELATTVQRTRSAIGYVEYAYAIRHRLATTSLRNREGDFVWPARASFAAAAAAAPWNNDSDLDQLLIDAPGSASWPITAASFILVPTGLDQRNDAVATLRFVDWGWRNGATIAAELDYVTLPEPALRLARARWAARWQSPLDHRPP